MQTITLNDSNISVNVFEDGDTLTSGTDRIVCPALIIGDMNSSNATIHTGVTPPEDWHSSKYLFDGSSWTANSDWVTPIVPDDVKKIP